MAVAYVSDDNLGLQNGCCEIILWHGSACAHEAHPRAHDREDCLLDINSTDALDQPHELVTHGLIVERGERSAHSQIDWIGNQGLQFLAGLADRVAVCLEIRYALVERSGDLLEPNRANPIDAFFIFLDLLERDAQLIAKFGLAHSGRDPPGADLFTELNVRGAGRTWRQFLGNHFR
jgi:hypothetical protein